MLVEQAQASDAVSEPAYRVAGAEEEAIQEMSQLERLHQWLDAPDAQTAAAEQALLDYLRA